MYARVYSPRFTIIDLFLPPLLLFPPFPWIQFWATPLHSVFPDTHCLRTFLLSSPSPLPVFRSLFPFESIHYVHLCQWLGINGATLLQTMTSEPVHGQITFRGNFSIPPSSLQSIREKKGKKKKKKSFSQRCFDRSQCNLSVHSSNYARVIS